VKTLSYKTQSAKKHEIDRKWHIIDAEGQIVGRMCTTIASMLRGKHKPQYTPHVDTGDYIIVINADKVRFTGNKMDDKVYLRYSGYPGGQKKRTAREAMDKKPFFIVENAVRGMLPKNKLGRAMFKKLFVYAGGEHPHSAQKPEELKIS
jgi:large subunit ribosomal protein L13